ncbi:MAG: hypothetical protein A2Y17_00215 [Clostridiales bacterium GWF2_38_85]|nr:MAG: hypothetical protein A2Y17_00215 [Clostridiales bacterium GWF2_38_85]HBL83884.1 radical SAM protein [Clostridiales bacterium]
MKKHINIPYFVPHEGCGHSCVFCSQEKITGKECKTNSNIEEKQQFFDTVETTLATVSTDTTTEIAFFGGSFTGIEEPRMIMLLEWAYSFVKSGRVSGIRLSTRPDYINEHKLNILQKYGVTAVELGVQNMNDAVLTASKRGHTADDTRKAAKLIIDYGFTFGGQMMLGLPLSTADDEVYTAEQIVEMGADNTRIYPILVLVGTELHRMRLAVKYEPPAFDELVDRGAKCLEVFLKGGVKPLRIGLQASDEINSYREYNPAYGELVWNRLYLCRMINLIESGGITDSVVFTVNSADISKAVGQKRKNINYLVDKYKFRSVKIISDNTLANGDIIKTATILN